MIGGDPHVAPRLLIFGRSRNYEQVVVEGLRASRGDLGGRASVRSPEDPVTQEERTREKEREEHSPGSAEIAIRHRTHPTAKYLGKFVVKQGELEQRCVQYRGLSSKSATGVKTPVSCTSSGRTSCLPTRSKVRGSPTCSWASP